ncbi:hypothetical protein BsWGS_02130 [Bradybaena similaris]
MEKYRDNMQQPINTVMCNTAQDATLNSVITKVQNPIIASTVYVNESELETSSLDAATVLKVADKDQDANTTFKGDTMTSEPMLDTSNVDNLQAPYSTDMVFSNSLAPEFNLMHEISKGKQASTCENNCTEKSHKYCAEKALTDSAGNSEQQTSQAGQMSGGGQVTETHNVVNSFVEDQVDEMTDETQEKQTAACTVGSAKDGVTTINFNNGALSHSMSSLPQLAFEVRPTYTSASVSTQIDNEVENIDSDSSACYTHQQTEISNFVSTERSSDFEPVILNVCGDYHEMETDGLNENQNLTSLEGTVSRQKSENASIKNTNTENINATEFVSKSASDLLQGMVQYAVSSSRKPKKSSTRDIIVRIDKCNTNSDRKLPQTSHPLLYIDTSVETGKGKYLERQVNCQIENASPNTDTVLSTKSLMLPRAADKSLSESGVIHITKKVPQSASLKTPAVCVMSPSVSSEPAPSKSSQILPNVLVNPTQSAVLPTTYSCVYVQDQSNGNQGQVAFLVPQSSLSDLSFLTNITSSVLSKMPVTELQTNVTGNFTSPVASSTLLSNNDNVTVMDHVSKFVTNTLNSFYLQGKDLVDTNLLKVVQTKRKESSLYVANCSVCGEGYCDEECLNVHLKRTVFHLLFDCSHCKQKIIFYNKCSFWMHLKNEESKLNYSDILWLKPYEFDAEDSYENQVNEAVDKASPETSAAIHPNPVVSSAHNLPAIATAPIEKVTEAESVFNTSVSAPPLSSRKRKYIGNISQCPVCSQFFQDLSAHLCPAMVRKFPCSSCGMFLPSFCAREAHCKIHLGVAKDICCPECGEKESKIAHGDDVMRSVFDHLDACKHFNRVISIQCFCKKEHNNTDSLAEHFTENHFRTIFKCPLCVLAFIQHDRFVEHADKIHNIKETNTGATVLCLFCQHVLNSCSELKVHLDQHVEHFKMEATFKWKCFICPKTFIDKAELNKHTDVDHPHKSKRCTICYSLFWSRKSLVEHIVEKKCLRSLAKKLNYCVDMQPDELKSSKSINLSNLLEFKQISHDVGKAQRQLNCAPVVSKKPLLVKIAPKVVSKTGQLVAGLQSQPKPQENILISQSVAPQKPTPTEVLPTRNKMSAQPCKIIITNKRNSTQFKKSITISQCVVCKQIMESVKLVEHLQIHQSQGIAVCLHCQRTDFRTLEEARKHSELCGHSVLKQAENPAEPRSDSSKGEDKTPEANNGSAEPNGGASEQQQMEAEEQNVEHQTHSVFPCLLCGLAFQSLSAREEHVSRSHDGIRVVYHCGLCRKKGKTTVFSRKEQVSRHITKKHRIGNMDTVSRLIWTEELNASSGQKLQISKSVEGVSAPKRLRLAGEGDYMCGKCGFSCSKAEEFSQHIASHNSNKEPQCPECGLCFTVFPALKKHLLAVHKIHGVEDYLKANNVTEPEVDEEFDVFPEIHPYSKPQPKLLDSGREKPSAAIKVASTNPLECTVCYKIFDIEANLKTHMRNHGMAFIRSKRHKV